ncbi:MAG: energy-coupling factor transporter ATPase, partial [Clostridia bacterium]
MSISIKNLNFTYGVKTPFEKKALDNISLDINEGDFLGIIGHTGSGKSTFVQHLNGLIKMQSGEIEVYDIKLHQKKPKPDLKKLRSIVGMVFQYPEYQLFDETVAKDVAFGPKNMNLEKAEVDERVKEAIELVGLDYEAIKDRSPFELSGGQKRRVAIAGVVAMRPKVLILDEPTAGLDPQGKKQILNLINHLKQTTAHTIVVISHDIDEITTFASRIVVFNDSKIAFDVPMAELFKHEDALVNMGLDIPKVIKIKNMLKARGIVLKHDIVTPKDFVTEVVNYFNDNKNTNITKAQIDAVFASKNLDNLPKNESDISQNNTHQNDTNINDANNNDVNKNEVNKNEVNNNEVNKNDNSATQNNVENNARRGASGANS